MCISVLKSRNDATIRNIVTKFGLLKFKQYFTAQFLKSKQALTKAYSLPHVLRLVGVSNKSEFICGKNDLMYIVLTWSEFRPDTHQVFMVNGYYTKYE